jgi:hypothetical protein
MFTPMGTLCLAVNDREFFHDFAPEKHLSTEEMNSLLLLDISNSAMSRGWQNAKPKRTLVPCNFSVSPVTLIEDNLLRQRLPLFVQGLLGEEEVERWSIR